MSNVLLFISRLSVAFWVGGSALFIFVLTPIIVPVILTEGIPLYTGLRQEVSLNLIEAGPYRTGIVKLRYLPRSASAGL